MTRRVTKLSVLTALFVASMAAILGSLAPAVASAAAVDPTGGSPTIDTTLDQWLDRSTILYNGTYYFDNKIDDNYTYDSQNAGADGCIDQIRFPSDGNTTATLYHNTKDAADPKCITSKKTQIDLTHAERSNMPFEFIDGNTIETSDKKNTYTYNDTKNAFLETGGDGCKDIVQVLNANGNVMSRTTLDNSFDGATSLTLAVTARTAGDNTSYDAWDSTLKFKELDSRVPTKDDAGCKNYGPHQYTASLALINNPDTLGDSPNAAIPPGGANASTLSLECNAGYNPLNWLICGIVDGLVKIIATVDNLLNGLLSIGTSGTSGTDPLHLFSTSDPSGKGYFAAWKSFRNIALGLLVIIGLVIIIAQEVGSDLVDAYTVRKTLPRLVVAAVGITLSWELMRFFVEFTNSLGYGIRALIYAPFTTGGVTTNAVSLGGGGDTAVSLIAGVASIALGIFGLLSFVATAALAIFIAFVVLVLRQIIIILLVMLAPIAIVAYILPNTKKLYDLWWDSFSRALILFPIISGIIAIGRVFSYEASQSANITNNNGLDTGSVSASVEHIIAFVAYFAPYFLIPFTLKFAGGALARIGAIANNPTRGAFNRLSNFRAKQPAKRWDAAKRGELYKGRRFIPGSYGVANAANKVATGVTMGPTKGFGMGAVGQQRRGQIYQTSVDQYGKEHPDLVKTLIAQDDTSAVMGLSRGTDGGARRAATMLRQHWIEESVAGGMSLDDATSSATRRADSALASARAAGINDLAAGTALNVMAQNKSRSIGAGQYEMIQQGIHELADGNSALETDLAYNFEYNSRQAGRQDLGGSWLNNTTIDRIEAQRQAGTITEEGATQLKRRAVFMDAVKRGGVQSLVAGHSATTKVARQVIESDLNSGDTVRAKEAAVLLTELAGNLTSATGENRDNIIETLRRAGVDVSGQLSHDSVAKQVSDQVNRRTAAMQGRGGIDELSRQDRITVDQINAESRTWGASAPAGYRSQAEQAAAEEAAKAAQQQNPQG